MTTCRIKINRAICQHFEVEFYMLLPSFLLARLINLLLTPLRFVFQASDTVLLTLLLVIVGLLSYYGYRLINKKI